MNKVLRLYGRILIAAAVVGAPVTHAQASLEDCVQINDDAQRLACYDQLAGRVMGENRVDDGVTAGPGHGRCRDHCTGTAATGTAASRPKAAGTTAQAPADPIADFGLSDKAIKQREPEKWVESVSRQVINVALAASDRYVITLDNGQVWVQSETNTRQILSPGDTATIKRAALGSYKLSGPRSVYWRVRRLR